MRGTSTTTLVIVGMLAALTGCTNGASTLSRSASPTSSVRVVAQPTTTEAGLVVRASAKGGHYVLNTPTGPVTFLTGINVGTGLPGRVPAELSVDRAIWDRWLPMIAETGVHAIRIYTLQPPDFYRALVDYNQAHPQHPLYLVHGVWVIDELLAQYRDLYAPALLDRTRTDVRDVVDTLHGHATLPTRQGYASGHYDADVSPWLAAWSFGVELDPHVVHSTDVAHPESPYVGKYVLAKAEASATEAWIAQMLDVLATTQARYGISVPLTFSNWPTTDPLEHLTEPLEQEDLVGVDANHLATTPAWPAGLFASYHAYPYYPDFQRYEKGIADYQYKGRADSYAGYLAALRDHHRQAGLATMILEFGVPSSIGSAHNGSMGRDQGGLSEAEAMQVDADMLRTQKDLGLAGGFVFSWQDEWFKRTWNTMDVEIPPDRRQLWSNPLTNEANFGLLAIEPDQGKEPIYVDGEPDDWTSGNSQVIAEHRGAVREIRAKHDAAFLYLRLTLHSKRSWRTEAISVGFDPVPGAGLPLLATPSPDDPSTSDTAIVVGPGERAAAYVRASNDVNDLLYGRRLGYFPVSEVDLQTRWNPQRLIVNRPLTMPLTQERKPVEWFDLNPLHTGSSNPESRDFDSRTVWAARDSTIELRVPWAVVGMSDPSSRQALVVAAADGALSTTTVARLGITARVGDDVLVSGGYAWEDWNSVAWTEREKKGLDVFAQAVADVSKTS